MVVRTIGGVMPVVRSVGWALAALGLAAALTACTGDPPRTMHLRLDGRPIEVLVAGPDGMRDRDDFGGADAMLFDLGGTIEPSEVVWVMDRVRIPLDIAWFDRAGHLIGTGRMEPCAAEPCPTHAAPGPYRWALEAPVGAFDDLPEDARLELPPA